MSTLQAEPFLARFLLGGTRSRVLAFLYRDPTKEYYLRQVIAGTGGSPGTVQREVRLLVSSGLVKRSMQGSQPFYSANREGPIYEEVRALLGKTMFGQPLKPGAARNIFVPQEQIVEFCRKNHITKLSFFGSVLRDDFNGESDIDVLVEFAPGRTPGWAFFGMEEELSQMLGRKVDLCTSGDLSKHFRNNVVREAEEQYASGA